jgi:hypothetical protein
MPSIEQYKMFVAVAEADSLREAAKKYLNLSLL